MSSKSTTQISTSECFAVYRGRVHAILNWRQRKSMTAAIVSRPLAKDELAAYLEKQDEGLSQGEIFDAIFPPHVPSDKTRKELMALTKSQLIHLILHRLHCSLPSLQNVTKNDLCTLFMSLGSIRFDLTLADTTTAKVRLKQDKDT